jgi:hypothetical protein
VKNGIYSKLTMPMSFSIAERDGNSGSEKRFTGFDVSEIDFTRKIHVSVRLKLPADSARISANNHVTLGKSN